MPSPIRAKNKNLRSGQSLVEGLIVIMFTSIWMSALLVFLLTFASWVFLNLDAYFLARAHLYGQQTHRCQVSSLWPQNRFVTPRFICSRQGRVVVYDGQSKFKNIEWNF